MIFNPRPVDPKKVIVTLSDKSKCRQGDFDLSTAEHTFDCLGEMYEALIQCELIQNMNIPSGIISIILSCQSWRESTIQYYHDRSGEYKLCEKYDQMVASHPLKDYNECCLLLIPPKQSKVHYVMRHLEYKCGWFDSIRFERWPEDGLIYFQIELFDGTNHLNQKCIDKSDYNVIWRSENIVCGKTVTHIKIKDIDVRLEAGKRYLLWCEGVKENFHAVYASWDPAWKTSFWPIYQNLNTQMVRELKLCDNKWILRNVAKMWEVTFSAIVPTKESG